MATAFDSSHVSIVVDLCNAITTERGAGEGSFVLVDCPTKVIPEELIGLFSFFSGFLRMPPSLPLLNQLSKSQLWKRGDSTKGMYYAWVPLASSSSSSSSSSSKTFTCVKPASKNPEEKCCTPYVGRRYETRPDVLRSNLNAVVSSRGDTLSEMLIDLGDEDCKRFVAAVVAAISKATYTPVCKEVFNQENKALSEKKRPAPSAPSQTKKVPRRVTPPIEESNHNVRAMNAGAKIVAESPATAALWADAGTFIARHFPELLTTPSAMLSPISKGARAMALTGRALRPLVRAYNSGVASVASVPLAIEAEADEAGTPR